MITKPDKQIIKSIIGGRYAPIIQKELIECNEFNKNGMPYSTGHITNIMNGEKHEIIEAAIYRVVKNRLEIREKRESLLYKKSKKGIADS